MAEIGNHVFSPENKIRVFGFDPGEPLPAMIFLRIYKKDDKSDYFW